MRSFADMVFLFDSHWFALGGSEVTPWSEYQKVGSPSPRAQAEVIFWIQSKWTFTQSTSLRGTSMTSQHVHGESTSPWRVNKFWLQGASMRRTSSRGHYLVEVHAWYYVLWVEQAKRTASFIVIQVQGTYVKFMVINWLIWYWANRTATALQCFVTGYLSFRAYSQACLLTVIWCMNRANTSGFGAAWNINLFSHSWHSWLRGWGAMFTPKLIFYWTVIVLVNIS